MAVMSMIALTMVGPHDEMEPVARQMVLSGGFQPIPMDYLVSDRSLRSKVTTESDNPYDELLNRMASIWKVAKERLPEPEPVKLNRGFHLAAAREVVFKITKKLETWSKRSEVLSEELERLEATKSYVSALKQLGMKPTELLDTRFALFKFGRLSTENYTRLIESTENAPIAAIELSRSQENVWVLVITVPGYRESSKKILDTVYLKEYPLSLILAELSQDDPLEQVEHRIELRKRSIDGLAAAAKNILKDNRAEYENLYSMLYTMQRVYDLCKGRGEVSGMYLLSGWIPEDTYEQIKEIIAKEAPQTSIIAEQVQDMPYGGLRIPTMLRNNRVVRAFQDVVAMYSTPSYGEVDPSPFVAFTFILFFGFMFGDVGHGAILFLAAWYMGKKKILSKSLAFVMKLASVSSVVFGFLDGSVMGMEDILPAIWLSPMHNTTMLFGVAIVMGVVMISFGMILNMVVQYRRKDFGRLLFDGQGMAGLFVYWGAAVAIYCTFAKVELPFPVSYLWYMILFVLILTLFRDTLARMILHQQSEERESNTLKVFEVLHNLMSYFTNTASFVRLAAFALNHVALSFAVIMISGMLEKAPGGFFLRIIMLVVGNLFIVGLEGLIVFIQVLRLEYYEFFSKFYKGGGNVFKPVTWQRDKSFLKN